MSANLLRRAIISAVVAYSLSQSPSIPAMSGGVPVDEILAAQPGSRF